MPLDAGPRNTARLCAVMSRSMVSDQGVSLQESPNRCLTATTVQSPGSQSGLMPSSSMRRHFFAMVMAAFTSGNGEPSGRLRKSTPKRLV